MEISYTGLSSLFSCEYSWYLRYIVKVPSVETSASVYGTALHRAIKIGYDNGLNRDEIIKTFKREWFVLTAQKDIIYSHEKDYAKRLVNGQEIIGNYYDKYMHNTPQPKATELRFGRSDGVKLGEHTLIGIIDQVDHNNKVIDYKSSKPTAAELDFDLQFTLYSYAYRALYGVKESALVLRHLGTLSDVTTTRTDSDFDILREEIDKAERTINAGIFLRNLGRGCANCYFLGACLGKERKVDRWRK